MPKTVSYEDAARAYCEMIGKDPDELIEQDDLSELDPGLGGVPLYYSRWEIVAEKLKDHDLMNRALASVASRSKAAF